MEIPFFRGCLTSPFHESVNKTVHMPEDDAQAFNEIINFRYSRQISNKLVRVWLGVKPSEQYQEGKVVVQEGKLKLALKTYTLGRKLGMEELPNKIMDALDNYKKDHLLSTAEELTYIFETSETEKMLRDFLMQHLACIIRSMGWKTWKKTSSPFYARFFEDQPENLEGVLQLLPEPRLDRPWREREQEPCKWHVHVSSTCADSKCPSPKAPSSVKEAGRTKLPIGLPAPRQPVHQSPQDV